MLKLKGKPIANLIEQDYRKSEPPSRKIRRANQVPLGDEMEDQFQIVIL
jgi:hypothetical protein